LWNDGSATQNRTGLAGGTYSLTVTDTKGCKKEESGITVGGPSAALSITKDSQTNVACNGASTGAINITISGGTGTKTYLWSDANTSEDRTGLAAGNYSVTVTDAKNCTATASYTITQNAVLSLSSAVTKEFCPGDNSGAIDLTVTGGSGSGYTYLWTAPVATPQGVVPSSPDQSTNQDLTSLKAGTYNVVVTDGTCTATSTVTVTNLHASPVTPGIIVK